VSLNGRHNCDNGVSSRRVRVTAKIVETWSSGNLPGEACLYVHPTSSGAFTAHCSAHVKFEFKAIRISNVSLRRSYPKCVTMTTFNSI
jgi:hypothetical protein